MKIASDKLAAALKQALSPLYLVSGDETLLVNEASDSIRCAARAHGFGEREVYYADSGSFDWEPFLQSANSLSLFSEKKLIEVRASRKNLSDATFLSYLERPNPDVVVLILTDKIDKQTQSTQWFSRLDEAGSVIQVWPLDAGKLQGWLAQRARQLGLQITPEALQLLQDRTEGNLLAAAQEIDKLQLLFGDSPISADQLRDAVTDLARYDVFGLIDAALRGDAVNVARMMHSLCEEGTAPFSMLSVLLRDLRTLVSASEAVQQGQSVSAALSKFGVWEKRQAVFQQTLKRHSTKTLYLLLQRASRIDLSVKGMDNLNPQDALENLCLALAGKKIAA